MRRLSPAIAGCLIALVVGFLTPVRAAGQTAPADGLAVSAVNRLGLAMLNRLAPGANAVMSPFSVETAMAMIDQGAEGATAAQIDKVFGKAASPAALGASNRSLAAALYHSVTAYGSGGPTLNSANDVWLQSGLTLDSPFASALSTDFGVAPQQADFAGDPSGALSDINGWISQKTNGLIPNLLNSSEVTAATTMVLANAVYLHADWTDPFPGGATNAAFATPSGAVQAPFMALANTSLPYAHTARYQAVGLDYANSSLQYVAVMPPAGQIGALQRWLSVSRLSTLMASLRTTSMQLEMPQYTLNLSTMLNGFLQSLGITDVFSGGLDDMVAGQPQQLSFLVHQATLEVANQGTTAAAATGGGVIATAAPVQSPLNVDLNRPFLVFIRDVHSGAILFAARVMDPTAGA